MNIPKDAGGALSNPAGEAKASADAYIAALLSLLGDRDPIETMTALPGQLVKLTEDLTDDALRTPEAEGKWSVLDTVQHLADSELVLGFRMRMALAHDEPELQGFDQHLWSVKLRYRERTIAAALEEFGSLRAGNLRLAAMLGPEELERFGWHSERGRESVRRMLELAGGHGIAHIRQIERIRRAIGA